MLTAREQADAVALAVDKPRAEPAKPLDPPKFPWPFADRTPSFVPKSITPARMDNVPTVWARDPGEFPLWLYLSGILAFGLLGALLAASVIRW